MSDTDDISGPDGDSALAAEYALGLLSPVDRARFVARLIAEPELRAELASWQARFANLDSGFAEATPSPGALQSIEKRVFGAAPRVSLWNSARFWRSFAAVSASVAMMAVAISVSTPPVNPEAFAARLVAALHAEGSGVSFVALYNPVTRQIRLTSISGDAVPDHDYELWAIEGDKPPMSMGVVPVSARTDMVLPPDIFAGFGAGTVLAITLEQKGGSPTGAPQGPVVAKGAATAI